MNARGLSKKIKGLKEIKLTVNTMILVHISKSTKCFSAFGHFLLLFSLHTSPQGLTSHSLKDEQVDTKIQRSIGYFMFKLQTTSITAMLPPVTLPRLHSHLSCRVTVMPMPIMLPQLHSRLSCHGVLLPIVL